MARHGPRRNWNAVFLLLLLNVCSSACRVASQQPATAPAPTSLVASSDWSTLAVVMQSLDPGGYLLFDPHLTCGNYSWLKCGQPMGQVQEINYVCNASDFTLNGGLAPFPPTVWSNFTSLSRLVICHCNINGEIPGNFQSMQQLSYLDLSYNALTSMTYLPLSTFPNLYFVLLGNNNFTGQVPALLGAASWSLIPPNLTLFSVRSNNYSSVGPAFQPPRYLNLYGNPVCTATTQFSTSTPCLWTPVEFCVGSCRKGSVPDYYLFYEYQTCNCSYAAQCFTYNLTTYPNASVAMFNDDMAAVMADQVTSVYYKYASVNIPYTWVSFGLVTNYTGQALSATGLVPVPVNTSGTWQQQVTMTMSVIYEKGVPASDVSYSTFQVLAGNQTMGFPFGSPTPGQSTFGKNNPLNVHCNPPELWIAIDTPSLHPPPPPTAPAPLPLPTENPDAGSGTTTTATASNNNSNLTIILVSVVVGGVLGAGLLGLIIFFCCCRRGLRRPLTAAGQKGSSRRTTDSPRSAASDCPLAGAGGEKEDSETKHALPQSFVLSLQRNLVQRYSLKELARATQDWNQEKLLGEGGYGKVYLGTGPHGIAWAVKRMEARASARALQDFRNEIELISRTSHRNLVKLYGYCDESGEQILVYEYVPNGNLRQHIRPKTGKSRELPVLSFERRLRIAVGAAEGLRYLHNFTTPPVVHRDIKCENILLDADLEAKVADFGFFKSTTGFSGTSDAMSTRVLGTPGYVDPEYYFTSKVTTKCDVYSFGVLLWELITGQPPIMPHQQQQQEQEQEKKQEEEEGEAKGKALGESDSAGNRNINDRDQADEEPAYMQLPKWGAKMMNLGKLKEIIDPALEGEYILSAVEDMAKVAEGCTKDRSKQRPEMSEVALRLLETLKLYEPREDSGPLEGEGGYSDDTSLQFGNFSTSNVYLSTSRLPPVSGEFKGR